jgi:cytochrome c-type biogenesis protein CcsB
MFIYLAASFFYVVYVAFRYTGFGDWAGKAASVSVLLGVLVHSSAIILRWVESYQVGFEYGYAPHASMYESIVFFSWVIMVLYIILEFKYKKKVFGVVVAPLCFLAIVFSIQGMLSMGPLVPDGGFNFLELHVLTGLICYVTFIVAFVTSVMYLIKKWREDKSGMVGRLPSPKTFDEITYSTIKAGFPFLTACIIIGAIWANSAWGTYWSWDPKETWAAFTWLFYAALLFVRYKPGWRGSKFAIMSIVVFSLSGLAYWGSNYIFSSTCYS